MSVRPKGYPFHTLIETYRSWGEDPGLRACLSGRRSGGMANLVRLVLALKRTEVRDFLGDYEQGLILAREALEYARASGLVAGQAQALRAIAELWSGKGEFPEMRDAAAASLDLCRDSGNRRGQADALISLGLACEGLEDYPKAQTTFEEALSLAGELGDKAALASSLYSLGSIHSRYYLDHARGLELIGQAQALYEELGDQRSQATCLATIGALHYRREEYARALECQQGAASYYQAVGDHYGQAVSLENLGSLQALMGNYPRAFDCYNRSLALNQVMGNRSGNAYLLTDIGNAHQDLGEFKQAASSHEQAVEIRRMTGESSKLAQSLANLASVELEQGNLTRAREALAELSALSLSGGLNQDVRFWQAWCSAALALETGEMVKAAQEIESGFRLAETLGARRLMGALLLLRARVRERQGDWAGAEADFTEGVRLFGTMGHRAELAKGSYFFGQALLAHGEEEKGRWYLGEAKRLYEGLGAKGWLRRMSEQRDL